MAFIKGKKAILAFYKDGDYIPFLCATDFSLTSTLDTVDVRTVGDGAWAKKRGQKFSYSISLNGLIDLQELQPVTFWLIKNYYLQMLAVPFKAIFTDDSTALETTITGNALIVTNVLNGVPTGFATSRFEMQGDGAYTITDATTICEATIGAIEAGYDPDTGTVTISYSGVSDAARLEYSLDGGGRLVGITSPGSSGLFNIGEVADGDHTITVWAVCENGFDGQSNDTAFTVSGGVPAPACPMPGTPEMSDITGTAATASWAAASPAPADDYKWELLGPLMTVLQSGNTSDLFVNLTSLVDGVTYTFRVKSLCTEGVDESSFASVVFLSEAPEVCNVPGTPVLSSIGDTTATATWTAPSPAPGSGYSWQVLNGVTVIDSGTTGSLSVNLTGLPQDTTLTFKVKSICAVGNESGYNSASFDTLQTTYELNWNFTRTPIGSSFQIKKNTVSVVSTLVTASGSFSVVPGDGIDISVLGVDGNSFTLTVNEGPTNIINDADTTSINESLTTGAFNYTVNASIT